VESDRKPTRIELALAEGKTVADVIAPGLTILFCGINPGLYSGAVGHHFARPGNRFWKVLFIAGFTDRQLSPSEERQLLDYGYGITNFVERATSTAAQLTREELITGAQRISQKLQQFKPQYLAILGVTAYRQAFHRPRAVLGLQPDMIDETKIWVLPNPSGLNAHYQVGDLAQLYRQLREVAGKP
jgi:double-stranded uracil-DNA glycosylase